MRICRTSMLCCLFVLGASMAMASGVTPTQFFDQDGNLIVNQPVTVVVTDGTGATTKVSLAPEADGTYDVPVGIGQNVVFSVGNPTVGAHSARVKIAPNPGNPMPVIIVMGGPANDDCVNGQAIALPSTTSGTTLGSSLDGVLACGGGGTQFAGGVWYTFTGVGTTVRLNTCVGLGGSADYDTKISVYCSECATLACVGGNDDGPAASCPAFQSSFDFCAQAGGAYRVLIHGFDSTETGNFSLSLTNLGASCTPTVNCLPPPPAGACCVTATGPFTQGQVPVSCFEGEPSECAAAGGEYQGDDSTCVVPAGGFDFVSNPATPIPDNAPAGVNLTINVPDSFLVADVNVDIGITHTWVSDLILTVTSPGGTSQIVWAQVCGSTNNINATADDSGTETFCAPINAGPIDSVFYPPALAGDGPLSVFTGESATGNWTFNASDNFAADLGTVNQWSLHFLAGSPVCDPLDCSGTGNGNNCIECEPGSNGKVTICHFPPGNPSNRHTIQISPSALSAHCMNHGDTCGACDEGEPANYNEISGVGNLGNGTTGINQNTSHGVEHSAPGRPRLR